MGVVDLVGTAVLPVLVLLGLGSYLRHRRLREPALWRGLEHLTYTVFTPALFIGSIAVTDLAVVPLLPLAVGLVAPVVLVTTVVVALRRALRADGAELTSLIQGSIRLNTYIGLVFAAAMNGTQGLAAFALACAVMVPLVNLVSVFALARWGRADANPGGTRRRGVARELLANPYIRACAAGVVINLASTWADVDIPVVVTASLDVLAGPALACGTLVAGAALTVRISRRQVAQIGACSVLKLVAMPAIAGAIAAAAGMTGLGLTTVVLICAVPTAPSAYVLALRLGGDAPLMASVAGVQTVLAAATLPLVLTLFT